MLFGICIFGEKDNHKKQLKSIVKGNGFKYQLLDDILDKDDLHLTNLKNGLALELNMDKKDCNIRGIKNLFGLIKNNSNKKSDIKPVEVTVNQKAEIKNIKVEADVINIFNNSDIPQEWKDPKTKLIWEVKTKENYENLYSQHESFEYAKSLNKTFYSNSNRWRVPTIDELLTLGNIHLFDYRAKSSRFNARESWKQSRVKSKNGKVFVKKIFSGFMNKQVETWYWSSSEVEPFSKGNKTKTVQIFSEEAWSVNFFEGGNYRNNKDQKNHIICVRTSSKTDIH